MKNKQTYESPIMEYESSGWFTLSKNDWEALIDKIKHNVTINGKTSCLVIAPDGKSKEDIQSEYDETEWSVAEAEGFVCLPPAGMRAGSDVHEDGSGLYWSSTSASETTNIYSYFLGFDYKVKAETIIAYRYSGLSVRLV